MRLVHWSEITPQPFLKVPTREMILPSGLRVQQTAGARNSRIPYEMREQIEVLYDSSYVAAYLNNAFSRLGLPLLSAEHYQLYFDAGLNPLLDRVSITESSNEYQAFHEGICDELATFAAMLPPEGNGSRNPKDYPVRWHHGVRLLEKLENLCQIEFKGVARSQDEIKARAGRF